MVFSFICKIIYTGIHFFFQRNRGQSLDKLQETRYSCHAIILTGWFLALPGGLGAVMTDDCFIIYSFV